MIGIYVIINTTNNKKYVGQSIDTRKRFWDHRTCLRANKNKPNKILQHAWNKYGEDAFVFEELEEVEVENLTIREQYWIDNLKPEYNIWPATGSPVGYKHSKETREKASIRMRELMKGRPGYRKGLKHTEETRAKMKIARSKQTCSEENKEKKSRSLKIVWGKRKEKLGIEQGYQTCSKCKQILPFENFNKNKAQPNGYSHYCKECMITYRQQKYDKSNPLVLRPRKSRKDTCS